MGCVCCFLGCSVLRSDVLSLCMLFQVVLNWFMLSGCFHLCEAVLVRVGLVLPVVFCLFWIVFHSIQLYEVDINFVFVFLRKFGCVRLFHDVPHCSGCFVSIQVVGTFWFFYVVLFVESFCMLDRSLL